MSANWIKTSLRFLYLFLASCPPKLCLRCDLITARCPPETKSFNFLRLNLVTAGNQVEIVLHTDSTVRAAGFELAWRSQLVSPCEAVEEVEAEEGEISLPYTETGYHLPYNCSIVISAPGRAG